MGIQDIKAETFQEYLDRMKIDLDYAENWVLRDLERIAYELDDLQRNYGILYYKPQEYQEAFHRSDKKIRLVLGGNQTGKTEVGVAEDLRIALGIDPYNKFKDREYPVKVRVVANDLGKSIAGVIMPKMDKLMPKNEIDRIAKYPQGYWQQIFFKNGSSIEFMSYEQETKTFEGWTGHYVHFDEPPPEDKFVATMRGLMRYNGKCAITATPLNEPWIYDKIFLKGAKGDKNIDIFEFSIFDNKYLPKDEVEKFIELIPQDERDARVYGKFKYLTGLVYKEFSEAHRIESFKVPKHWTRVCACDYHPRKPCYFVWVAIDEQDIAYVYDELNVQGTIETICERVIAKEKEDGGRVRYRFIDSLSAMPDRISGKCPQLEIARQGVKLNHPLLFRAATKDWASGKNAVSQYLSIRNDKSGIYFFKDKVPYLIESLTKYVWSNANSNNNGKDDRPMKVWDDAPDALRYVLVLQPKYIESSMINAEIETNEKRDPHDYTGYHLGR